MSKNNCKKYINDFCSNHRDLKLEKLFSNWKKMCLRLNNLTKKEMQKIWFTYMDVRKILYYWDPLKIKNKIKIIRGEPEINIYDKYVGIITTLGLQKQIIYYKKLNQIQNTLKTKICYSKNMIVAYKLEKYFEENN